MNMPLIAPDTALPLRETAAADDLAIFLRNTVSSYGAPWTDISDQQREEWRDRAAVLLKYVLARTDVEQPPVNAPTAASVTATNTQRTLEKHDQELAKLRAQYASLDALLSQLISLYATLRQPDVIDG